MRSERRLVKSGRANPVPGTYASGTSHPVQLLLISTKRDVRSEHPVQLLLISTKRDVRSPTLTGIQ